MVEYMIWVWLGAVVLFGVVEAATAGLVSIWFVAGALAALVAAAIGASLPVQAVIFLAVSAVALALTRPLVKKLTKNTLTPTNLDRVLGETARVVEPIDNDAPSGAVYVDGKTWTARSAAGERIPAGELVKIEHMEGVKLFVKTCETKLEVNA